jgi:hypothetical protein
MSNNPAGVDHGGSLVLASMPGLIVGGVINALRNR